LLLDTAWRYTLGVRRPTLPDRLAGGHVPPGSKRLYTTASASIAWRNALYRQAPHALELIEL